LRQRSHDFETLRSDKERQVEYLEESLPVNVIRHPDARKAPKWNQFSLLKAEHEKPHTHRMWDHRMMCWILAHGSTDAYKMLYEETDFVEVHEMDAMRRAADWNVKGQ
jgi:hypothetical protein